MYKVTKEFSGQRETLFNVERVLLNTPGQQAQIGTFEANHPGECLSTYVL